MFHPVLYHNSYAVRCFYLSRTTLIVIYNSFINNILFKSFKNLSRYIKNCKILTCRFKSCYPHQFWTLNFFRKAWNAPYCTKCMFKRILILVLLKVTAHYKNHKNQKQFTGTGNLILSEISFSNTNYVSASAGKFCLTKFLKWCIIYYTCIINGTAVRLMIWYNYIYCTMP